MGLSQTRHNSAQDIVSVSAIVVYFTLKQPLYLPSHLPRIMPQQVYLCDQVKYLQYDEMMGCPSQIPDKMI